MVTQNRTLAGAGTGAEAGLPLPLRAIDLLPMGDGSAMILLGPKQNGKWQNAASEVQVTAPFWIRIQADAVAQYGFKVGTPIAGVLAAENSS